MPATAGCPASFAPSAGQDGSRNLVPPRPMVGFTEPRRASAISNPSPGVKRPFPRGRDAPTAGIPSRKSPADGPSHSIPCHRDHLTVGKERGDNTVSRAKPCPPVPGRFTGFGRPGIVVLRLGLVAAGLAGPLRRPERLPRGRNTVHLVPHLRPVRLASRVPCAGMFTGRQLRLVADRLVAKRDASWQFHVGSRRRDDEG